MEVDENGRLVGRCQVESFLGIWVRSVQCGLVSPGHGVESCYL